MSSPLDPPTGPEARTGRAGWFFLAAACLLAGLLAASPTRGGAVWLHLAAGRAIERQGLAPPEDSLSYAAVRAGPGPNWLFDLALYRLHRVAPVRGVMLAHALLVALLTFFIAVRGRTGHEFQISLFCSVLALLAMAAWLAPSPTLVSALLLGLTLFLLDRLDQPDEPVRLIRLLPLWLLFPLWACLDSWMVLGLAVVFLRTAGAVLQDGPRSGRARKLLLGLVGAPLAVLLQPRHYHAFELPAQLGLSEAAEVLRNTPLGRTLVVSPLRPDFWSDSGRWISSSAWAVLLVAGAFSFVAARRRFALGRFLVWLAAAGLSLYQARAIPMFAVAAAPELARNLQEALADREPLGAGGRAVVRFLQVVSGVAMILLLVAAWPGWLQPIAGPRRLTLEPNPALVRLARRIDDWQRKDQLPAGTRIFPTSLESAHHLVWWCPGRRGFLDTRLDRFDRSAAQEFIDLRRGLSGDPEAPPDWRDLLRKHAIGVVLLNDSDPERFFDAFRRLDSNSDEWDLLALEGNSALFGWRDGSGARYTAPRLDIDRLVVDPPPEARAPESLAELPGSARPFFDDFVRARPIYSPDRDEAWLYLRLYEESQEEFLAGSRALWENSLTAGLVGMAPGSITGAGLDVALRLHLIGSFPRPRQTDGKPVPPAPVELLAVQMRLGFVACRDQALSGKLLLAVRACRRALSAAPRDSRAWFLLGEAYRRLESSPAEGAALGLARLNRLRQVQACAAYGEALRLRPNQILAHERLAALYGRLGYLDLRLEQLETVLRLARSGRGRPSDPVGRLEGAIDDLSAEVKKRRKAHESAAEGGAIGPRARDALARGLARRALEVLLGSNIAAFGPTGARLELELLLLTGRGGEARGSLTEELEELMGRDHFLESSLLIHSSQGDYALAQRALAELIELRCDPVNRRGGLSLSITEALLWYRLPLAGPAQLALQTSLQEYGMRRLPGLLEPFREEAELEVLRGRLALEQGDIALARRELDRACSAADSGVSVPAADVVRCWRRALAEDGRH